ncbi:hypothetical protein C0J52_18736 [Blattella germanica]|nr:hypothetical protein C0J52_18736 [Blattella germanica]
MKTLLLVTLTFIITLSAVEASICAEDACVGVDCEKDVPEENQPPCKDGQKFNLYGTYCGCCSSCQDIKQLGESCTSFIDMSEDPPMDVCNEGLVCKGPEGEGVCKKKKTKKHHHG